MGWMILGEHLTRMQYLAAALIVLGVYVSQEKAQVAENRGDSQNIPR